MSARESRPSSATEAAHKNSISTTSVQPLVTDSEAKANLDGCLVLLVQIDAAHYRRRVFLSLNSAQRALSAARARGYSARIIACELHPLTVGGVL
ncbi:hypothetical protein [Luteococcus japonicus]|uniref:hypothetical protein n=1 Tax=Luteococcus japonicus TaxID=33984 RepID=UPI001180DFA6|nr:hypothetical protein [Luteococcus japonicus]